jgi:hypothetical protein
VIPGYTYNYVIRGTPTWQVFEPTFPEEDRESENWKHTGEACTKADTKPACVAVEGNGERRGFAASLYGRPCVHGGGGTPARNGGARMRRTINGGGLALRRPSGHN